MQTLVIPRNNNSTESVASFIYLLRSGSKDDPDGQTEIHHLCEHLLFANIDKTRYPIFTIFRTTMEYTIFQFLFPAKYFANCLHQISSLLWEPCITKAIFKDIFNEIIKEEEERKKSYTYDFAFKLAKSYWGMPTSCGNINMSNISKLISSKHQNFSYHLLSYTGPQNESEIMSALNSHWFLNQSQNTNKKTNILSKTNDKMDICGYLKRPDVFTLILTTPGYNYIPDFYCRIISGYVNDTIRHKIYQRNSRFSYKKLFYPEKCFHIMFFQQDIEEKEIISIVKDVLHSLYLDKDVDKNRMTLFLRSYEFEWIIRYESTADIARELTYSVFRGSKITSLENILSQIRNYDIEKHREMTDQYLSIFTKKGKEFENINALFELNKQDHVRLHL